jgi:hypothetical protein
MFRAIKECFWQGDLADSGRFGWTAGPTFGGPILNPEQQTRR